MSGTLGGGQAIGGSMLAVMGADKAAQAAQPKPVGDGVEEEDLERALAMSMAQGGEEVDLASLGEVEVRAPSSSVTVTLPKPPAGPKLAPPVARAAAAPSGPTMAQMQAEAAAKPPYERYAEVIATHGEGVPAQCLARLQEEMEAICTANARKAEGVKVHLPRSSSAPPSPPRDPLPPPE